MLKLSRNIFLIFIVCCICISTSAFAQSQSKSVDDASITKFNEIAQKAKQQQWYKLDIGEVIGKVAFCLQGTRYEGFTLEGEDEEICRIKLTGLDCVTFFESSLNMARIFKQQRYNIKDLINAITFTRYRDGKLTDYTSRLHYTADWIYNNINKNVVEDITKNIGGNPIQFSVSFMSKNPKYYNALKINPNFIAKMAEYEKQINSRTYYYIPKEKVADAEKFLKTGDIITIVTSKQGLDYSHTGLIYRHKGKAKFMHASSKAVEVTLDKTISEYLKATSTNIGITVLRPILKE